MTDSEKLNWIVNQVSALHAKIDSELNASPLMKLPKAAKYLQMSEPTLRRLIAEKKIPYHQPNGKIIYFDREDLDNYLRSNRVASYEEIQKRAVA